MTKIAEKFIDAITLSWDSPSPWTETARLGLSEVDLAAISEMCGDADLEPEDCQAIESEVLAFIRAKVDQDNMANREPA